MVAWCPWAVLAWVSVSVLVPDDDELAAVVGRPHRTTTLRVRV
jgi:hypothetical protein